MTSTILLDYKKPFQEDFDALIFLRTYYDPDDKPTFEINNQHIKDAVDVLRAQNISGGDVLEVGCGPYIANSLIASHFFDGIYPADYSESMVTPLRKWLNGDMVDFDNNYIINNIAQLLQQTPEELTDQTKEKMKKILHCDVHNPCPIEDEELRFDAIITRFCIDSCSPDKESYMRAIGNVSGCLKDGGHFLQMGFFTHGTAQKGFWNLGSKQIEDIRLTKKDVQSAVQESSMTIVEWRERSHESNEEESFLNTSTFTLLAVKN